MSRDFCCCFLVILALATNTGLAQTPPDGLTAAERGYWYLLNKPYLSPDFNEETIENIWQVWPTELRKQAEQATPEQRRDMVFRRYGFTTRPGDTSGKPLQYVVTANGGWVMNCFSCHSGKVEDQVVLGMPNTHFAMQTLTEDSRQWKAKQGRPFSAKDVAVMMFPMGGSVGTTNAVIFGVIVGHYRDEHMEIMSANRLPPPLVHHDMDAPPFWHFRKKQRLYTDGFVEKNHRALIPFVLSRHNTGEVVRGWEEEFRDIATFLESLTPPKYPYAIDQKLAARGEQVFLKNCADCHGTYGKDAHYDPPIVPLAEIGTDPLRLQGLPVQYRKNYSASWLTQYGEHDTIVDPEGYIAPPLDGIWASAPYLHNGSVPTLWHLFYPEKRPEIWRRTADDHNLEQVGLTIETVEAVPANLPVSLQREYFQTKIPGKSAAGHNYPALLTDTEKQALLEYLKTL